MTVGSSASTRVIATALLAALLGSASVPALAQTVTLDPVTIATENGGEVLLPKVEAVDTNLTKDELAKLFTKGTPPADLTAIVAKAKAAKLSFGDIAIKGKDGGFVLKGTEARDINAGRIGRLVVAGVEGGATAPDEGRFIGNPLTIDGLDLSKMVTAAQSGDPLDGTMKVDRISWDGFDFTFPDKETKKDAPGGNLIKMKLGSLLGEQTYAGNLPLKSLLTVRGFVIEPPPSSPFAQSLKAMDTTALEIGVSFAGSFDAATKTYTIDDYSFVLPKLGTVSLKAQLGNMDPAVFTGDKNQRMMAAIQGTIAGLQLRVIDDGGMAKAFSAGGGAQGKSAKDMQAEAAGMASQILPALLGGTPAASATAAAVAGFISNPKSLTVDVKPLAGPIPFLELAATKDPMALLTKVAISAASETGSAPAPAPRGPAVAGPVTPAPSPAPAAPSGQTRKLSGVAAANALVGNTVQGKNADGDVIIEYYLRNGTVKQLNDDEVITGKWSVKGEKICLEFPDDDEETCYKLEVAGNIATYTDDDGVGRRFEIFAGNPKNL